MGHPFKPFVPSVVEGRVSTSLDTNGWAVALISFDEALAVVAAAAGPLGTEVVMLDRAAGRVLAADIIAALDSPRADVSAMDGYAVRDADLARLPLSLRIIGESFPGAEPLAIAAGECARIFTGAPVPAGADRVVIQEIVRRDGDLAIFDRQPGSTRHIRNRGSDFKSGERLLTARTFLDARTIVAAAAADLASIEVFRRPRFAVVATGDELAEPGTAREQPMAIPDSVALGVTALGEQWGGECVVRLRVPDDRQQLEAAARKALDSTNLVVVIGGASVGEKDFAKAMFGPELALLFSKVSIKPGKPVWLGRAAGKLVLGLPGNPTSALVVARLFLAPLLYGMAGRDPATALAWRKARLAAPLPPSTERETFIRARWTDDRVEPLSDQDSGAQGALAQAELLVRRVANATAAEADGSVDVLAF
jgi:molybdopterin molybdotransferase